jgi:hypothetical protein
MLDAHGVRIRGAAADGGNRLVYDVFQMPLRDLGACPVPRRGHRPRVPPRSLGSLLERESAIQLGQRIACGSRAGRH